VLPAVKPLDPPAKPPSVASAGICEPTAGETPSLTTDKVKNLPPLQRVLFLWHYDYSNQILFK
jgi:hypothetical protein